MIKDLKEENKVTIETIIWSFIVREVQPIKRYPTHGWLFKEGNNTSDSTNRPYLKQRTNCMKKLLQPDYEDSSCHKVSVVYSSENPRVPVMPESLGVNFNSSYLS